ncbi:GDSL-like Lipase/Acylhydrolase family protein [Mycobacterium ulcerans str. Harvey]|uniref:GDSL-like Lipase/Acylhydrolase family protein n=1 Tax=Mycobacterium ulcerans str. Harvey TaxID=1299332 RepID=A0ABN0R7G2_MYCUL|nr:GDSL-like Lipase/Acylhydrolase family protein [Mycobacterium ulcerans str. Harvey]
MPRRSTIALATAGALASTGTAYLGARNLLVGQATHARTIIPKAWDVPPRADGVYSRGGGPVQRWRRGTPFDLHLMMFGDSTACGYGCGSPEEVPGVVMARKLAEQTGKRVRLSTKALVGATSKGVCGQVDAMFVARPPPDATIIIIGANDMTALNGIGPSAERLGSVVRKLRARGAIVVVGTCPDFSVITAIPQPLRSLANTREASSPALRPPPSRRPEGCRFRSPICWHANSGPNPNGCSPPTDITHPQRRTPWRPISRSSVCAMRYAKRSGAQCFPCRRGLASAPAARSVPGAPSSPGCGGARSRWLVDPS